MTSSPMFETSVHFLCSAESEAKGKLLNLGGMEKGKK